MGLLSFLVGIYVNAYVEISVEVKIENISIKNLNEKFKKHLFISMR